MNLSWLPIGAFAGGIAALAAGLFLLQRLRVRHREVVVVTNLFWREAVEETRARVFVQRFRHPWAYVLVLAVAGLIWLAASGPERAASSGRAHVLVLDASAHAARGDVFAASLEALTRRAGDLPRATTSVLCAGAHVRTLLSAGEEAPLLGERARDLRPEAAPGSVDRALRAVLAGTLPEQGADIEVFGSAPIDPALVALLPANVTLSRAATDASPAENEGIAALGVSEPVSGAWSSVDVLVEVAGSGGERAPASVTLDGAPLALEGEITPNGRWRGVARDVPAHGGRIEARVAGDRTGAADAASGATPGSALVLDDRAALVLPDRPAIRVALSSGTPAVMRTLLAADPGVVLVEDPAAEADVAVRRAGETSGGAAPALVLTEEADQAAAFVLAEPLSADPQAALLRSFEALGLDEIDSTGLAEKAQRAIGVELVDEPVRGVSVWASLLEPGYDFTATRAFPLFVARAVRWLAGEAPIDASTAAGDTRSGSREPWVSDGRRFDPAGSLAAFPRAGDVRVDAQEAAGGDAGRARHVALLDADVSRLARDAASLPPVASAGSGSIQEVLPWVVLAALALLLVEWWLVRTERMP